MKWYYILGMISYGIFLFQFLLSVIGADTDLDVDLDGDADLDASSLFSFKGLIHFLMGFSGWLMLVGKISYFTVCTAVVVGVVFMILLFYLYKLCMRFHSEPTEKSGVNLIGYTVKVITVFKDGTCLCAPANLPYQEIQCYSSSPVKAGDLRTISSYKNGKYNIS